MILPDCDASLPALDGLEIDLCLVHAPDPRTPWRTSVRALAWPVDAGLMPRVGVSCAALQQAPFLRAPRSQAGRPSCWCRPPLPGLHRTFAATLGVRYVHAGEEDHAG